MVIRINRYPFIRPRMSPDITDSREYPVDRKCIYVHTHSVHVSYGLSRFDKYSDGFNCSRELIYDIVAMESVTGVVYCYIYFYSLYRRLKTDLDHGD